MISRTKLLLSFLSLALVMAIFAVYVSPSLITNSTGPYLSQNRFDISPLRQSFLLPATAAIWKFHNDRQQAQWPSVGISSTSVLKAIATLWANPTPSNPEETDPPPDVSPVASDTSQESTYPEGQATQEEAESTEQTAKLTPLEEMIFQAINRERSEAGISEVGLDEQLTELARLRSQDMVDNNYFAHVAPDGTTAWSLMTSRNIGPGYMGEILGRNNSPDQARSVESVVKAFMESRDHRSIILTDRFTSAGVGAAINAENMKLYTILFFGP